MLKDKCAKLEARVTSLQSNSAVSLLDGNELPGTKRKKIKNKRDPNAPKKAKTAYIHFCGERRPIHRENGTPGNKVMGPVAAEWNAIKDDEHKIAKYTLLAEKDKQRYNNEMKEYNQGKANVHVHTTQPKDKPSSKVFITPCDTVSNVDDLKTESLSELESSDSDDEQDSSSENASGKICFNDVVTREQYRKYIDFRKTHTGKVSPYQLTELGITPEQMDYIHQHKEALDKLNEQASGFQ